MLAKAGVAPKVAMDLMRHSDVNLTMRLYSHTVLQDRATAVETLPEISKYSETLNATGTDGKSLVACEKRDKKMDSNHGHFEGISSHKLSYNDTLECSVMEGDKKTEVLDIQATSDVEIIGGAGELLNKKIHRNRIPLLEVVAF